MTILHKIAYSENNIIGLIILLLILLNLKSSIKKIKYDGKLYLIIILSTSLIIILDIIIGIVNGATGYLLREIHIILVTIYFILSPIPYMAWSLYVDYYIYKSIRKARKTIPIVAIPAAISIIICVLSIYNKKVFFIDENNLYQRGNLFWLNATLYYSYCLGTYIQVIVNKKSITKKDYYSLLTFGIVPIVAGIFQTIDTSKSYIWLGISLSALIIYLNIQNDEINEDYLTGLYNRRELDRHLRSQLQNLDEDGFILMVMIDLNFFKTINDTYGHIEGDEALKHTANILRNSFRSEDCISRYGGDEFAVISKIKYKNSKEEIINRIRRNFHEFNKSNLTPYDISISLGYDVYDPELKMEFDEFINHIDKLMYEDKERVKKEISRKKRALHQL